MVKEYLVWSYVLDLFLLFIYEVTILFTFFYLLSSGIFVFYRGGWRRGLWGRNEKWYRN